MKRSSIYLGLSCGFAILQTTSVLYLDGLVTFFAIMGLIIILQERDKENY